MVAKVHAGFVAALDGFEVVGTAATGARRARRRCARLRPDLVLLDVYLPDMTGLEVLRRLRAGGSSADVIVISAARDVESIRSALHGGVLHYLVKPFDRRAFETRLRDYAVAARRAGRAGARPVQDDVDRMFAGARGAASPRRRPRPRASRRRRWSWSGEALASRGGRGAVGDRVQRAHRAGAGERPPLPGAAGRPAGGRRPPAVRDGRPAGAPVHPARRGRLSAAACTQRPKQPLGPQC